jgi:hypothetical protein
MHKPGVLRLMRMVWGFRESAIILVANDLDLFSHLALGSCTVADLAPKLQVDARRLRIVMDALVAMGLLNKEGNFYRNQELAQAYLVKGNPDYRGEFLKHLHLQSKLWSDLAENLRTGRMSAQVHRLTEEDRQFHQAFIWGMDNMGKERAERISQVLDLGGVHRMLDLGGGAATYSIAFSRRNPKLRSMVLDLPLALAVARENVELNGLKERIDTLEGSYWEVDFGTGYDLMWISQIIHSLSETQGMQLIRKAAAALEPQGRLIVHDSLLTEDHTSPYFAALFSVYMLAVTEQGRCYTVNEVEGWLNEAGLIEVHDITVDAESMMVIGIKP